MDLVPLIVQVLRRITRVFETGSRQLLRDHGITGPQLLVLQHLVDQHDGVPISRVARDADLSPATVTEIVSRLEVLGYVQRSRDAVDRRVVNVFLTESGLAVMRRAELQWRNHFQGAVADLEDWEQHQMLAVLKRIAAMLSKSPATFASNKGPGSSHITQPVQEVVSHDAIGRRVAHSQRESKSDAAAS